MRRIFKAVANAISLVLVMPAVALYGVGALMFGRDRAFPGWSQAFSLLPGFIGVYLRRAFYRVVLRHCDAEACISFGTVFSHSTARIGRKVYIGVYCSLGDITLEDDVLIASHVSIVNGGSQHGIGRLDRPVREQTGSWTHITIGQDSWIGDRAVVMADVGRHCIIGAGAVVTRAIPDYAIAVGVPAKVVRFRNEPRAAADLPATLTSRY